MTVFFGNGKVKVDPQYDRSSWPCREKAKTYNGYMIQVKGYASACGSVALNQKLSEERANNVTNILLQQGHIPLTNMLARARWARAAKLAAIRPPRAKRRTAASSFGSCRTRASPARRALPQGNN